MNRQLKNVGKTVTYIPPVEAHPVEQSADLRELVQEMKEGKVETLLILGVNPVFTAPADLEFEKYLQKVPLRVHLGLYQDETAVQCHWHINEAHYLEAWGDARAFDGTASIVQPLIAPLYDGRSVLELLAALFDPSQTPGYELVRGYWRDHWPKGGGDFERSWEKALLDGFIAGTAFAPVVPSLQKGWSNKAPATSSKTEELEILFRPDPALYDGQFANNGWLQEMPKPLSKLTWDNAAFVSPATAKKFNLTYTFGETGGEHGRAYVDMVELEYQGRKVEAPVWILPGHADEAVTVYLGHGRTNAGRVGNGTGFNAYTLRTSAAPWVAGGVKLRKTGRTYTLACTQGHHSMEDRDPIRTGKLADYEKDNNFVLEQMDEEHQRYQRELVPKPKGVPQNEPPAKGDKRTFPLTMWPPGPNPPTPNRWGMAIDLTVCTGCSACVVACQAENNSPVVGKEEVTRGREMHWIRVDRYYKGDLDNPETYFQPLNCQQCEDAPCELVCPVGATVHSADGLNDMVYNRCVGTRYCSNNCPYKVRRFNFFQFADFVTESLKLGRNPEVTVRSRGVMEKCTYCVQRIRSAQIDAEIHNHGIIVDGAVKTACQQACPANAILFGDMNDPKSAVSQVKSEPLDYGLLAELHTRPRTTYLAALRNPNPELE